MESPISGQSNALFSQNDSFRPQSSICLVEYMSRNGTGAIIEFPESTSRTLFVTSFQVAPIRDLNELTGLRLVFEDKTIGNVTFTPNWVKTLWTSPTEELDVTVIELSSIAMTILSRSNFARLYPATAQNNERISVRQYLPIKTLGPNEWEMTERSGTIDNINEKIIEYSASAMIGSPGSPILNAEFKILGLESQNEVGSTNKWKAIGINQILEAHKNKLLKQYGGRTENEIWRDRINETPVNDLLLIWGGVYGKVYKLIDKRDFAYALKIVEAFGGPENYKSQIHALENEYRLVTSLQLHPRIIQFFAFVRDDLKARVVIIMEYMEGGSLYDKINHNGCLTEIVSLRYLGQLMEGVEFLHKNQIYHSDIKPANILLTNKDDLKLSDFGIAVHMHTNSTATSSNLKGSQLFMSPERLNEDSRSAENDIWSVGATFATMISGHPLNYNDRFGDYKIANYEISINSIPLKKFLKELPENDYKREIISRTLCSKNDRAKAHELLEMCQRLSLVALNRDPAAAVAPLPSRHSPTTVQTDIAKLSISESHLSVHNLNESTQVSPNASQQIR